jgi:outer membrane lipoprotein-sorting protein
VPATPHVSDRVRRRLPWIAPLVVAGVAVAAFALTSGTASGAPTLPARTAAQLIAKVAASRTSAFFATITETAQLGLPSLPGGDHSTASLSWESFVTGTHTARIWVDGGDRQRLALLGELSEADVVHNGADLWTYTSDTNTVSHTTLSAADRDRAQTGAEPTPSALAAQVLKAVTPSTSVTVGGTVTVAGRAAYTLEVRPKDPRSTVREVAIAIDAKTDLPLRVQLFGSASAPALEVGFSSISYSTPAASIFEFHAPAGAAVSSDPYGLSERHSGRHGPSRASVVHGAVGVGPVRSVHPDSGQPTLIGRGWTSVIELRDAGSVLGGGTLRDASTAVGSSGARLVHTTLINAVVLPDGRAFVGAVTPALLEHVAATTAR